ncbi:MAG TPA: hypothetical protein VGB17_06695 [Pyrinomonadaceae bacterium]|jgi:hypothetical protein
MKKIDEPGWTHSLSFISYGVRVGVRANSSEILERVKRRLPPGWKPVEASHRERLFAIWDAGRLQGRPRFHLLFDNEERLSRSTDLDQILDLLESSVRLYVAETSPHKIFVHAGAVGWRGRAIVIPGRSFSGKTTLVAELVRAGASYYSDEYAVFDARGRVSPFPKPLSLRLNGDYKQQDFAVEELGGRAGVRALPVGLVLVSSYKRGARWRPRQLSAGHGALALLANTVAARREPERALATFQKVVAQTPVLKGVRGEAGEVARAILKKCEELETPNARGIPLRVSPEHFSI